jgi:transcriptional regulator with XRE-family HTH domain
MGYTYKENTTSMSVIAYIKIRQLREFNGLSQESVAKSIGLSRPTYAAVEQGEKDLTLTQLYALSMVLKVKASSLLGPSKNSIEANELYDYAKFKELILACLRFGGDTRDGRITKTKLAKLVYLADFNWFFENHTPMTGMVYRHIKQGPVADEYFRGVDELFNEGLIAINPSGGALMISLNEYSELNRLSRPEINLIKKICSKWRDRSTSAIVEFTHQQKPWRGSENFATIPYETILTEHATNLF